MNIFPLSEGAFSIDQTKQFVPFDVDKDNIQDRPAGSLLVEIQPFLVITSEDILLLDSGLGFETEEGSLQLHKNLAAHGINPADVTKVLMTHLHKDHAGGLSRWNPRTGTRELSFPHATHYIQKQELDFAFSKGLPSYVTEELEALKGAKNVVLLDGDGVIDGYIKYTVTGGHSPYHQVFYIVDGGEKVFFGGDEAPQFGQMKKMYMAKYDYNGRKAMELRQEWWKQGQEEGWYFLFYHDVKTPVWPVL